MKNLTTLAFPQQLLKMDLARLKAYRDNLDFYEGNQWPEPQRRRERRLTFNYARTLIDKSASFVMNGVSFAVDPADGSPEAAEAARRAEAALWTYMRPTTWSNWTSTRRSIAPSWATRPSR